MFSSLSVRRAANAAIVLASCVTGSAHADAVSGQGTWETTLQARYFTSDQSKGPDAYYDTALNITWLADTNQAFTSGYTSAANGGVAPASKFDTNVKWTDGRMGWDAAKTWTDHLVVGAYSGLRLPNSVDTGTPGCDYSYSGTDCGYNASPSTSEMAHMFYVTLGNKGYYNTSGNVQSGWGLTNTGPFSNFQSYYFWTGVEYAPYTSGGAWVFHTGVGYQSDGGKPFGFYAWAVHDGDVGMPAVPEPETYALMLAGFGALTLVSRQRWAA